MPQSSGSSGKGYDVTSSGTNSQVCIPSRFYLACHETLTNLFWQGNHYDSRDYTPSTGGNQANDNTYHYSNNDGKSDHSHPLAGQQGERFRKEQEAETGKQEATITATRTDPPITTTAMADPTIPLLEGRSEPVDETAA